MCIYPYAYVCAYVCIYMCMFMCMYMYRYICMYAYVHICAYGARVADKKETSQRATLRIRMSRVTRMNES